MLFDAPLTRKSLKKWYILKISCETFLRDQLKGNRTCLTIKLLITNSRTTSTLIETFVER